MNIKPKFVAKYNVWLELHDELICVCDKDKTNSFVLGSLTQEGIARNRDVTKEQFEAIALLYSTAERYFYSRSKNGKKNEINKYTKPKYVAKYNLWLELIGKDIYICFVNKDNDFILGTLTQKGIVRNRSLSEDRSIIVGLLYTIAENHFSPSTRDSIDRTTARFININRWIDNYLMFEWQSWLELKNQEVYLYPLAGEKCQKIACIRDIPEKFREALKAKGILEINSEYEDIDPYEQDSDRPTKQISFIVKNIFEFVKENDLLLFKVEILNICQTNARRFFCPSYRKNQQAWRKFRHDQKYKLIQDAIDSNTR
ncbi:MAG: hypothetical protein AAF378_20180 [Cyanobacteria bacterium P01_A01_bin.84]